MLFDLQNKYFRLLRISFINFRCEKIVQMCKMKVANTFFKHYSIKLIGCVGFYGTKSHSGHAITLLRDKDLLVMNNAKSTVLKCRNLKCKLKLMDLKYIYSIFDEREE